MFACIMIRGAHDVPQTYANADTLLEALTPYDQDDIRGQWTNDQMLMVQALTWNTAQSRHENTPEVCKDTGRVIVSWVRLDNRAALCTKLGFSDSDQLTDPQIILAAHHTWGPDCADQLEGDFSFVIYDPSSQQLFSARDSLGAKPLFYYVDDKVFIAATTAAIFPVLKKLSFAPCQNWIARFVNSMPHEVTKSAYTDVLRLAPAHSLQIGREGSVEPLEYFEFKDTATIADTRDPAYVGAYREAFHSATEARLRSDFLIGIENSGGLDSVSIMGHAVKHLPHHMDDFHCFGLPKQVRDQELIIKASVQADVRHTHLSTHMNGLADPENFDRAVKTLGYPVEHSQINIHMPALRQSESLGIRTMLSGYGGDEIVTSQATSLGMELYNNGQFKTLQDEMHGNALTKRLRYLKRMRSFRQQTDTYSPSYLGFIERGFKYSPLRREAVEDLGVIAHQKAQIAQAAQAKTLNERNLRNLAFNMCRVGRLEACTVMGQSHRVEYRWPMYDRQLIQQYLLTPAIEKRHQLMGRYLHRRAVAGTIPDTITWQRTKDMGDIVDEAFSDTRPYRLDKDSVSPHLASLLDFEKLDKMYDHVQNGQDTPKQLQKTVFQDRSLWLTIAVARWLAS